MHETISHRNHSVSSDCYPCIFSQVDSLARLLALKETEKRRLFESVMQHLMDTGGNGLLVRHIIRKATDAAIGLTDRPGKDDLFLPHI